MITPTIRTALNTFQQAANRGTAVHLSPGLVQELRDALKAEPEGEGPALDHASLISFAFGREPWATWLRKGGCLESAHCELSDLMLAAIVRWDRPTTPPSLETPAEALAARPLLEQVAAMADCIGANTVGQITAISNRAAAWLRQNPPGQPVAIEPTPPAPEPGELVAWLKEEAEAYRNTCGTNLASQNLDNAATLLLEQGAELAALRGVPVAVSERLPKEGDCNAEGRCWCYTPPVDVEGMLIMNSRWILSRPDWRDTHWLPFNALPLPAPQAGDVQPPHPTFLDAIRLAQGCHDYSGGHSGQQGEAFQDGVGTVVAVLKKAAVRPWDSQTKAVFAVGSAPQGGEGEA